MRLDTATPFTVGGPPPRSPAQSLDDHARKLDDAEAALESRQAALQARLAKLASSQAEMTSLVAQLEGKGIAVDGSWSQVFCDPKVNVDPDCEALSAAAAKARAAALTARERAVEARRTDLDRRTRAATEMSEQAAVIVGQAREALERASAPSIAPRAAAPAKAPSKPAVAPSEQRAHPRVQFEATVDFESDHNFFTGFSSDISEGGLFIATVNVLPVGSRVEVKFSIGNGPSVAAAGTVRWVRDILDDAAVMPGMGVQFDALPDYVREGIHKFIDARTPLFFA